MVEPLPVNTRLYTAGGTYIIRSYLARGGTAFLYSAVRERIPGTVVLKEACPKQDEDAMARKGLLIETFTSEAKCRLAECRVAVMNEWKTGRIISDRSARAKALLDHPTVDRMEAGGEIAIREEDDLHGPGGSVFCAAQSTERQGQFLSELIRDSHPFTVRQTVLIVRHCLKAIKSVHDAGYLHGDACPANLFMERVTNPTEEDPYGEVYPLDFGCARPVNARPDGGEPETDAIKISELFSSPKYTAPEYLVDGATALKLTKKVDVYAIGAIALELLGYLPEEDNDSGSVPLSSVVDTIRTSDLRKTGASPALAKELKAFLKGCLADQVGDRDSLDQALKHVNELCSKTAPPKFRLSPNLGIENSVYEAVLKNRKEEIAWLDEEMKKDGPVFLYGLGGIGKTSLAIAYAKLRFPGRAYRATFSGDLRETIAELSFTGFADSLERSSELYRKKMDILREQYAQDCLLILDNFDSPGESLFELKDETYYELIDLPMHILITTRSNPDTAQPTPELEAPSHAAMVAYFLSIAGKEAEADYFKIFHLVKMLDCHPLSVQLAAKSVSAGFRSVSVDELLSAFQNLAEASLPKVALEKDHKSLEATIYGHLRILFRLADLTAAEQSVLRHASIMEEEGLDGDLFYQCESEEEQEALRYLTKRSLLQYGEDRRVRIHPMVRQVVRGELAPTEASCEPFLSRLELAISTGNVGLSQALEAVDVIKEAGKIFSQRKYYDENAEMCMMRIVNTLYHPAVPLPYMMRDLMRAVDLTRFPSFIPGMEQSGTAALNGTKYEIWNHYHINGCDYILLINRNRFSDVRYKKLSGDDRRSTAANLPDPEKHLVRAFMKYDFMREFFSFREIREKYVKEHIDALVDVVTAFNEVGNFNEGYFFFQNEKFFCGGPVFLREAYLPLISRFEEKGELDHRDLYADDWLRTFGGDLYMQAEVYQLIAGASARAGRYREAIFWLRKAEDALCRERRLDRNAREFAGIYHALAYAYGMLGDKEKQAEYDRRAESFRKQQ